jgi:hypothetical protein
LHRFYTPMVGACPGCVGKKDGGILWWCTELHAQPPAAIARIAQRIPYL